VWKKIRDYFTVTKQVTVYPHMTDFPLAAGEILDLRGYGTIQNQSAITLYVAVESRLLKVTGDPNEEGT